jgi:hypothetical protein
VRADEAVPLLHEPLLEEVVEVLGLNLEIAGGVEKDDVVILQVLLRKILRRVLAAIGAEQVALHAELGNRDFGRRELPFLAGHAAVAEAGRLRDHQQAIAGFLRFVLSLDRCVG